MRVVDFDNLAECLIGLSQAILVLDLYAEVIERLKIRCDANYLCLDQEPSIFANLRQQFVQLNVAVHLNPFLVLSEVVYIWVKCQTHHFLPECCENQIQPKYAEKGCKK